VFGRDRRQPFARCLSVLNSSLASASLRSGARLGPNDKERVDASYRDEARIRMAIDQRRARVHVAPEQGVDREVVLRSGS
jgi:hypothetical protein